MGNKNSHKDEPIAEQNTVSPRMQVFPASTVQMRGDGPCINLPRECRDVRYCRIVTTADGTVEFIPAGSAGGVEITPRKDGYRTYAPMPAGTEGVRYRRVINRTTGIVSLTPISRPQFRRVVRRKEEEQ